MGAGAAVAKAGGIATGVAVAAGPPGWALVPVTLGVMATGTVVAAWGANLALHEFTGVGYRPATLQQLSCR